MESALNRLGPLISPKLRRRETTWLIENRGSASVSENGVQLILGISLHRIRRGTEELEFECTLRVPSLERLRELLELKDRALLEELSRGQDLIRMPTSWFQTEKSRATQRLVGEGSDKSELKKVCWTDSRQIRSTLRPA